MSAEGTILTDRFERFHSYLRISITEKCNFRCTYCMPLEGIPLSPKSHIMTYEEIFTIAEKFVALGVRKIRITGGEPLVRKDVGIILQKLSTLPVELSITTNGVLVDQFMDQFKACGIRKVNFSIDSLREEKFNEITKRKDFDRVLANIKQLTQDPFFEVKLNCVLIKGFNEMEIVDFVRLTKNEKINVRFIEFMPFEGNKWDLSKLVTQQEVLDRCYDRFGEDDITKIEDAPHDTSRNYRLKNAKGSFAIISTVSNPFCDTCNRIRLTANGKLKNCLFSDGETDLLTPLRAGQSIDPSIHIAIKSKQKRRGGMSTNEDFSDATARNKNRSMIAIGG